jgi:hypothetical protein
MAIALATFGTLMVAACGGTAGGPSTEDPVGDNAPSEIFSEPAEAESTPPDNIAEWREAWTWDDGLSVRLTKPKPFVPSDTAATGHQPHHIKFTVTIVNDTDALYDPAASLWFTMQSGNREADQVFDGDMGGSPSTKLLPGREAAFQSGWNVMNPDDLVFEVQPSFDHQAVLFVWSGE